MVILLLLLLILAIALPLIFFVRKEQSGEAPRLPEPPTSEWSPQEVTFSWEKLEYIDWYADAFDVDDETRTLISGYDLQIKSKSGKYISEEIYCH